MKLRAVCRQFRRLGQVAPSKLDTKEITWVSQTPASTTTILAVIANEPEKALLIAKTQGYDLIAPHSLFWEIGNAFSAMIKRGRITLEQAIAAIEIYRAIPIDLVDVDLEPALEIVDKHKVYAYDAYMIVCAKNRGCPLLTLDSGLVYAAKAAGLEVWEAD